MKLNKLFIALAATAFVACSNEDLSEFSANQAPEQDSRLVELSPNFAIAGVGVQDATTRSHWDLDASGAVVNVFLPIWATAPAGGNTIDVDANLDAQAVGLCWLGEGAAQEKVFTNYMFYHFGWLNDGETEAEFECDALTNGALYDEVTVTAGDAAGDEADPTLFTLPGKSLPGGVDYNSGVYKTDNKAIFGGKYIVYYPFNEDFKDAAAIPAEAITQFGDVAALTPYSAPKTLQDPALGYATFRYSAPVEIEGGDQAANFGLSNLSTLVQLKVFTPDLDANIGDNIDQIVLWSASKKFYKKVSLAADKIVAGKKGTELYAETEGTKTITANFIPGDEIVLADEATAPAGTFITVLPTEVADLKILVHNSTKGKWATVDKAGTKFEQGKAMRIKVCVAAADFKADYIAVDYASLVQAVTEANNAATTTATNHATVTVIGDIELTADPMIESGTFAKSNWIDITGDDIIVPENVTFTAETNMLSSIRVLGKSCCSNGAWTGGRLTINGGTISNVTMEETEAKATTAALYDQYNPAVTYSAAATIAAGKTVNVEAGNVYVNAAVQHKGNINIAEGANLTVNAGGDLNFMGSTVVNGGTIEVKKNGKYDMTDANGNATASDGQRMTNNGKFIHNVDAGVGTAVQKMNQNGEYRCKVDMQKKLDDALLQWTACSVIEMVNTSTLEYDLGKVCQHNGKYIDFEVNATAGTTFSNPTPDNKEINIGKLTVKSPFAIDYTNTVGTTTGKRTLTVNGDMAVTANTSIKDSKKINIKQNLTLTGAFIDFAGAKKNEDGLAVTGDITVSGSALLVMLMLLTSHALTSISRAVLKLSSVTVKMVIPRTWLLAEQLATLRDVHSTLLQLTRTVLVLYLLGLLVRNLRLVVPSVPLDQELSNSSE